MLRSWRKPHSLLATGLLAACASHPTPTPVPVRSQETISLRVSEGTTLAFDLSPDGRSIAFDLLGQLWLLPLAGGEATALTDAVRDTAEDLDPSFSPDGRRLLFRGERRGQIGLWLLDMATGETRQLTRSPLDRGFEGPAAWSPDGRSIAFARVIVPESAGATLRSEIVLLDPATGTTRAVRTDGLAKPHARDPTWIAASGQIGFIVQNPMAPGGGAIATVDPAGGSATLAVPDTVRALTPAFSPDGRQVAYFAPDSAGRTQVWLRQVRSPAEAGAGPIRLTSHADVAPTRIRWVPDGSSLVYSADGRLWQVRANGTPPTEIPFAATLTLRRDRPGRPAAHFAAPGTTRAARGFMDLELSPDGGQIAMLALGRLWVTPVGGMPRAVADVPHDARHLAWSADGSEVAWSAGALEQEDIFATELRTGRTSQVTSLPGRELYPAYSPDGKHLAFIHGAGEDSARVLVVDAGSRGLTDPAQARRVGVFDLGWLASDALVPQWSPGSDAMLDAVGGFGSGQPTQGQLMTIAGTRRSVEPFPDSPIYLQWVDGALLYVRHDRLWRLPFDTTGVHGDPVPLGSAPAMYASAARDGSILFVSDSGLRLRRPDGSDRMLGWPLSYTTPAPRPLVIRNLRLIDGTGTGVSEPRDLVLEQGRIARIEPAGAARAGSHDVIDAGGRIAIPGLFDLHAHTYQPSLLPGYVYFGVTTIRDQGAPLAPLVAYSEAIAAGQMEGPRVGYGGFQYYSDWAFDTDDGRGVEPEADSAHVARAVALAASFGSQHIKTRTFRRWDINARMVAEAHRLGMRATGHCAHQLPLVAAGMDAMEHVGLCGERGGTYLYDDIVQLFRAAGIGVVPTVTYWGFAVRVGRGGAPLDDDPELAQFLPPGGGLGWMLNADSGRRRGFVLAAERSRRNTVRLARGGVIIGTGTDVWQVPGGVHMEMEELVAAGLTPLEAITAATASSARIIGADQELGTIAVGNLADLVILDADPVADIRNTRRIWKVVKEGRAVDREAIARRRSARVDSPPE